MIAILEFIFAITILPFLALASAIRSAVGIFADLGRNPFFLASLSFFGLGAVTWFYMEPDTSIPWKGIMDVIGTYKFADVPLPYAALALSVVLGICGVVWTLRTNREHN